VQLEMKPAHPSDKHFCLSSIISHLSNLIICVNAVGKITEFNNTAEDYFERKSARVLGKNFISFCKTNHIKYPSLVHRSQQGGQEFQQSFTSPSGQKRSAVWKIIPRHDSANHFSGIILLGTDISKEKNANTNIKNVELHLESVIESIAGNHWWKDINGCYMGFNGVLTKVLGFKSSDEIIGKTDSEIFETAMAAELIKNDREVITTGKSLTYEERVPTVDGRTLTFIVTKVPLRNEFGDIVGTIGTSVDITELKSVQAQLKIAKEQAEKASQAKSDFIANISHDLRTPLSGILGAAELLKSRVSHSAEKIPYQIADASKVLLNLFDEIIEYIKTEADSPQLQNNQFSMKQIVDDIVSLLKLAAEDKKLKLKVILDTSIPNYLIGDISRIHRILLNLVSNAIKFTKKGFVAINITLAKENEKAVILKIIVKDTGIGIPSNKLDQIFTRFTRLNTAYQGTFKGAGLGLSIVKQFVEEMGGEIHVESQLNKGSQFICVISFKKSLLDEDVLKIEKQQITKKNKSADSVNEENSRSQTNVPITFKHGPIANVLLIEDDPLSQTIAQHNLEAFNCIVDITNSGYEAIAMFKKKNYHLVLTDVGLPDINGYQITTAIRAIEAETNRHSLVPIIAVTAHVDAKDKKHFLELGGNEILAKPLLIDTIRVILVNYLGINKIPAAIIKTTIIESTQHSYPIDLDLGAKLIKGNRKAAKEMLALLIEELPSNKKEMASAYKKHNYLKLMKLAHRLHGATCYCGTPKLKEAAAKLEKIIASNKKKFIKQCYEILIEQIEAVMQAYNELK
jgi:two-component system aerobic respiration control sensor histidine kinase ArcB